MITVLVNGRVHWQAGAKLATRRQALSLARTDPRPVQVWETERLRRRSVRIA
jgi:hypothetical protein